VQLLKFKSLKYIQLVKSLQEGAVGQKQGGSSLKRRTIEEDPLKEEDNWGGTSLKRRKIVMILFKEEKDLSGEEGQRIAA